MKKIFIFLVFFLLLFTVTVTSNSQDKNRFNPKDIKLEAGYAIEPYIIGLSVPTTAVFDGEEIIVAESGFIKTAIPRVIKIAKNGVLTVLADKGLLPPVTGLLLDNGTLFISHKTKVSTVQNDRSLKDIVTDLPSNGDHQNNNIVLGQDGKIYLGQGTTTNAGIVGEDSYIFGWLEKYPKIHEVPCKDITLIGNNFTTGNPLTKDNDDQALTGAYKPFGIQSNTGDIVPGNPKCGGSIVRFDKDGANIETYAWGLRNPFGLEFDRSGNLWTTFHGADVRGSRSVFNNPDYLVKVEKDAWYGWPEYFDGTPVNDPRFKDPTAAQPELLWQEHPPLTQPFLTFPSHEGANGITISKNEKFGHRGDIFIAMFGSFLNVTSGVQSAPVGYRVVRVNTKDKKMHDFASNRLPGPAYINQAGGFNRPADLFFGKDGALYVVDWGAAAIGAEGLQYVPATGSIWRIYNTKTQKPIRPNGPIQVDPAEIPKAQREESPRNVPELWKHLAPQLVYYVFIFAIGFLILLIFLRTIKKK